MIILCSSHHISLSRTNLVGMPIAQVEDEYSMSLVLLHLIRWKRLVEQNQFDELFEKIDFVEFFFLKNGGAIELDAKNRCIQCYC